MHCHRNTAIVTPDSTWHPVEIGDFNGDNKSDVLWRNDSGQLQEWQMNGSLVTQSLTPTYQGNVVQPGSDWITQAKPTNFG
jgi:hypothetical protein